MEWYDEALKDLQKRKKEDPSSVVDGAVFLRNFFSYGYAEDELGLNEDSTLEELKSAVREYLPGFEKWLRTNQGKEIYIYGEADWGFQPPTTSSSEAELTARNVILDSLLTLEEQTLLDNLDSTKASDTEQIESLKSIYNKIYSEEGLCEQAMLCANTVGDRYDDEGKYNIAAEWYEKAGLAADKIDHMRASDWFKNAGKAFYRIMDHDSSAKMYTRAFEAGKKASLSDDELLEIAQMRVSQLLQAENRTDLSEAIIEESELRLKCSEGLKWITRFLFKILAYHGERPSWVFCWAIGVIIACSFGYYWLGISTSVDAKTITEFSGTTYLYFSVVTFTTLGYGDFAPLAGYARLVASIEAVSGLLLTSLFLASFLRKYTR